jgi:hypothetical protein
MRLVSVLDSIKEEEREEEEEEEQNFANKNQLTSASVRCIYAHMII